MIYHPVIKSSFFLRFLIVTALLGNMYVLCGAILHTFNLHFADLFLRYYGFKAAGVMQLVLVTGTSLTIVGCLKISREAKAGFKLYLIGKLVTLIAYTSLIIAEYIISGLAFPFVIIPVLIGLQVIYPLVLYVSLRKISHHYN